MAIKIFIDQGHNPSGPNTGAEFNDLREQDITYVVGKYLYDLLHKNPNFEPKLSRENVNTILGYNNLTSLQSRVKKANLWGADYFLSIHTNASVNQSGNGTEAYVYRLNTQAYILAEHIVNAIVTRMATKDRGVFARPGLYVLRKTKMPAILIELAFISNPNDAFKLRTDPYGFAFAIYTGILKYFGV